jgi:hypothetical protein
MNDKSYRATRGVSDLKSKLRFLQNSELCPGDCHEHRQEKTALDASLYTLLQILSVTLFEKMPLQQDFPAIGHIISNDMPHNQLNLFTI